MPDRKIEAAFIKPMLLLRTEKLPVGPGWLVEPKFKGYCQWDPLRSIRFFIALVCRILRSVLFEVQTTDPATLIAVVILFTRVALLTFGFLCIGRRRWVR
jgi:hypothetical protein